MLIHLILSLAPYCTPQVSEAQFLGCMIYMLKCVDYGDNMKDEEACSEGLYDFPELWPK